MLHLRILGGFALEGPSGSPVPRLPQRRAEAVLAVLAVAGDLGCTRERLVGLLWPESDEAHARHGLRDALHAIRLAAGPDSLVCVGDLLKLDPSVIDSDTAAFEHAIGRPAYGDAVVIHRGPLLEGFHVDGAPDFERWLDGERARLAREFLRALEHLGELSEAAGDWAAAAEWWGSAVEHDPFNSRLVLRQMRALAASGESGNALRVADAHRRRLRLELDMEPDAEFTAQVVRLRNGGSPSARPEQPRRPDAVGTATLASPPPVPAAPPSGDWLSAVSSDQHRPSPWPPRKRPSVWARLLDWLDGSPAPPA